MLNICYERHIMKFTENDLTVSTEYLNARAMKEAKAIYSKPSTRQGRSLEQIYFVTRFSHVAEHYLIDCQGFTDDTRPFKDVFDTKGVAVEVKATSYESAVPNIIAKANAYMQEAWRDYPKVLYIFIASKTKLAEYTLYGIYKWNGKTFVETFDEYEYELG